MTHNQKIVLIFAIIISLVLSFVLGRYSVKNKSVSESSAVTIISSRDLKQNNPGIQQIEIRASSQGTKYYFPWCESTFNEENIVYFQSIEEAENQGYQKATSCALEPSDI